jgi:two-component system, NarL family, nitrate/nitrite response regulator NarL
MKESISLVIVDDHPIWREGVVNILQTDDFLQVVAEGATACEATALCKHWHPNVLLLDLNIPGGGLQAALEIVQNCPSTQIIMLTSSEEEEDVLAALAAGVRGYVLKGVPGRELRAIVWAVAGGTTYVAPSLTSLLLHDCSVSTSGDRLSPGASN